MTFGLDSVKWDSEMKTADSGWFKVSMELEPIGYMVSFELYISKTAVSVFWELSDGGSLWGVFDKGKADFLNKDSAYVYMLDTLNQLARVYSDWDYDPLTYNIPYKETA